MAFFFLRKKVFTSCSTTLKQTNKQKPNWSIDRKLVPRGSRLPSLILAVACTFDVILPEIADPFQIISMLAGYEESAGGF